MFFVAHSSDISLTNRGSFIMTYRHSCPVHSGHRSVSASVGRVSGAVMVPSAGHAGSVVRFVRVPPVHEPGPRRSGVLSIA